MNSILFILSERIVEALGWTLFHSLWQGVLFAIVMATLLVMMQKYR